MQLQELKTQISRSSETMKKMSSETGRLQNDKMSQVEMIESLRLKEVELQKQIASWKSRYEQESANHRKVQEQHEQETAALHKSITDLKSEMVLQSSVINPSLVAAAASGADHRDDSHSESNDLVSTPDNSPPLSPVKATPSRNSALEAETIKLTLGHANRMVNSLKSTLLKEKNEKMDLRRQISDLQLELNSVRGTNVPLRPKRSKHFGKRPMAGLGSGDRSTRSSYVEDSDSDEDENTINNNDKKNWEAVQEAARQMTSESEEYQSTFETAPEDQPTETEDDYHTGQETMDEDSSAEHTETEETPRRGLFHRRDLSFSNDDDDNDVAYQYTRHTLRKRSMRTLRSEASFAAASPESSLSILDEVTPVKQSNLASEFLSIEEIEKHAESHGLITLPIDDYDDLTAKAELGARLTPEELPTLAKSMGFDVVPSGQVAKLEKELEDTKSEDFVLHSANAFGLTAIPVREWEKLSNPGLEDLQSLAAGRGLKVLANEEHNSLVQAANRQPTKDELITSAASLGLVALSNEEHDKLIQAANRQLSEEEIVSLADSHGYITLSNREHQKILEASKRQPSRDEPISHASSHGLIALPQEAHQKLVDAARREPTKDELITSANLHGLVTLPTDEHEKLVQSANKEPSMEEFISLAASYGMVPVPNEQFDSFSNPSLDDVRYSASKHDYVLVSKEEHEKLTKPITHEELDSRAKDIGFVLVSNKEYTKLSKPTLPEIKGHARAQGHRVIPMEDYEKLSKPSQKQLEDRASAINCKLLSNADYDKLVNQINRPLSREELEVRANEFGLIAIPTNDYFDLVRFSSSPSPEELKDKADKVGMAVLPKDEFNQLVQNANAPTLEYLQSKAAAIDSLVVDDQLYKDLRRQVKSPTPEELQARASKMGFVALPDSEFKVLQENAISPSEDYLRERAKVHKALLVPEEEFSVLKANAEEPSLQHLMDKAALTNHKLVPSDELEELQMKAHNPSQEHIKELAAAAALVAISSSEYSELLRGIDEPAREEIEQRAAKLGLDVVPSAELNELRRAAENPTEAELKSKAENLGLITIQREEHSRLVDPPIEEVLNRVKEAGNVVLSKDEYLTLTKPHEPTPEEVKSYAEKFGLIAIPSQEYQKMTEQANGPVDESFLKSAAAGMGLSLLASSALEALRNPAKPSLHDLDKLAADYGHKVIPANDLSKLKNPSKTASREAAEKHGFKVLDSKEYENLTKPYQPSLSMLENHASSLDLVTVPKSEYAKLTSPLPKDDLIKQVQDHGLIVVDEREYTELNSRPKEFNPTANELRSHAKTHNLILMPVGEHDALQRQAVGVPNREQLEKLAPTMGLSLLPTNELQDLRRKSSSPTKFELDTVAAQQGYAVVSLSVMEELHRKLDDPNKQDLDIAAGKLGFILIKPEEIKEARRKADNPTLDEMKSGSSKFGVELISNVELNQLRRKANSPTKEELIVAGEAMNLKVIPREWYEDLEKTSTEPDEATIAKFGKRLGLSLISAKDLEDLQRKAEKPAKEDVEYWARKLGLVILTQDQYAVMERAQSNRPVIARDLTSVAAKRDHFEDIIKQSNSPTAKAHHVKVLESIKSLGYVPVLSEEYKKLIENQNVYEPTRGDILRAAKSFGLVCIGTDEYRSLLKKTHNTNASISSVDMLSLAEQDSPTSAAKRQSIDFDTTLSGMDSSPSKSSESGVVMKSVPAEYLASLRRLAENPSKEDLNAMAIKLGLVVAPLPDKSIGKVQIPATIDETVAVSRQEYEELRDRAAKYDRVRVSVTAEEYQQLKVRDVQEEETKVPEPTELSVADIREQASKLGLVTLSSAEFESLKESRSKQAPEPTKDEVEVYAQKFGLVTLPVALYSDLSSRRPVSEPLSEAELKKAADNAGLVMISKEKFDEMSSAPSGLPKQEVTSTVIEERKPSTSDEVKERAKDLGLVVLSMAEFTKLNAAQELNGGSQSTVSLIDRSLKDVVGSAGTVGDVRGSPVTVVSNPSLSYNEHTGTFDTLNSDRPAAGHGKFDSREFHNNASESDLSEAGRDGGMNPPIDSMAGVSMSAATAAAGTAKLNKLEKNNNGTIHGTPVSAHTATVENRIPEVVDHLAEATAAVAALQAGRDASQLSSAATITSQTSLNDRNMIAYITQVVIGEYLFKYTRRIGVTGISENRHERFFWIHPYTLTLYWSEENPAVESRHSQKTRSAAILGVKAVEDRNPLPPGLHHKSIVIQAPGNKELRITCPNRQRHNIWYNSIQYLLKRSMEDLSFEEHESNDDYVQDTRFERERAKTSLFQTGRQRIQSIRRSMAPEMNATRPRASSRQASIGSFNMFGRASAMDDASSRASSRLSGRLSSRLSGRMV